MSIPSLEHHCGSWIIVNKITNKAVFETFSREVAEKVNQEKYRVLTALEHLVSLNKK